MGCVAPVRMKALPSYRPSTAWPFSIRSESFVEHDGVLPSSTLSARADLMRSDKHVSWASLGVEATRIVVTCNASGGSISKTGQSPGMDRNYYWQTLISEAVLVPGATALSSPAPALTLKHSVKNDQPRIERYTCAS